MCRPQREPPSSLPYVPVPASVVTCERARAHSVAESEAESGADLGSRGGGEKIEREKRTTSKGNAAWYAVLASIFGIYAQVHPGHGVFEGRKPTFLDSGLEAALNGPLFVWYEVAFACGWHPALKQELDAAVAARHAAWDL